MGADDCGMSFEGSDSFGKKKKCMNVQEKKLLWTNKLHSENILK